MLKLNVFGYSYVATYLLNLTPSELRHKMAVAQESERKTVILRDYLTGDLVKLRLDNIAQMAIKEVSAREIKEGVK